MPRSPDEILAEIAAWPLADRLRLAARIIEEAARATASPGSERRPPETARPAASNSKRPAAPPTPTPRPASPAPSSVPAPAAPAQPRSLVIVDGSNFLGTVGGYELASDASREELVTRLQDFVHQHPAFRVIVYFDGQKSSVRRAGGVEVRFTSRERPADFFILEGLRGLGEQERRRTLVVTADRALADSAHKLGAKAEATTSFQRRLPGVKRTAIGPRGLNATEVAEWEDYFNRPPEGADRRRKG